MPAIMKSLGSFRNATSRDADKRRGSGHAL